MPEQNELLKSIKEYERSKDSDTATAIRKIAESMVKTCVRVKPGDKVLIWFEEEGMPLVKDLYEQSLSAGVIEVSFYMRDLVKEAETFSGLSTEDEFKRFYDEQKRLVDNADAVIMVAASNEEGQNAIASLSPDLRAKYFKYFVEYAHKKRYEPNFKWTGVRWPSLFEAKKEGLKPEEYFKLFLEACDQPWEEIKKAQEHLIEKLDEGKELEIYVNEQDKDPKKRTKLKMNIEGMTFGNSTIDVNFPGSEVFSAPVLRSLKGQLFAPGKFLYQGGMMENIHLYFVHGKIDLKKSYAEEGNEHFKSILNTKDNGEGVLFVGEIAFGTNPGLIQRLLNSLLCEKVGGSFHIAIGHCYTDEEFAFLGPDIHVNNGNTKDKTPVHWDISVLMHPQYGGGRVVLDGKLLSKDGKFLDRQLAVLNPKI